MGANDTSRRSTPRLVEQRQRNPLSHPRQTHEDPGVTAVVVRQVERLRVSLEKHVPIEEINPHCNGLPVLSQPSQQLPPDEEGRRPIAGPRFHAGKTRGGGAEPTPPHAATKARPSRCPARSRHSAPSYVRPAIAMGREGRAPLSWFSVNATSGWLRNGDVAPLAAARRGCIVAEVVGDHQAAALVARRCARSSRARASFSSRAAQMAFCRPARKSFGVTYPMALWSRTLL